jgi:hypothetical protein
VIVPSPTWSGAMRESALVVDLTTMLGVDD